jgi:hypothetical protein
VSAAAVTPAAAHSSRSISSRKILVSAATARGRSARKQRSRFGTEITHCRTGTEAVVALLAERLGIDAPSIAVVSGHGSPAKVVEVDGMADEAIRAAFPAKSPGKPVA